jgi:hypothetical protein
LRSAVEIEAEAIAAIDAGDDLLDAPTDGTDVSLQRVIQDSLGLDILTDDLPGTDSFCVSGDKIKEGNGGLLEGYGGPEDIWAYSDNGTPWSEGTSVGRRL